ncbi:Uncharacterized protein Adt_21150 [Abeliophyllum distichum]|uniref:Retroviral polymerase SH3-like domain-containing protein n=1 Tax=Abeliophyllum distichum TaxID=126358 RepID=A0ABD1SYL3_9LAMI
MATNPITEIVAIENQTVATVPSPSVNQTVAQVPSFAVIQTLAPTGHIMWEEAVLSANYLLNKVPRKKEDKSPYELLKGRKSSYKYLRVWSCLAKVAVLTPKKVKIGPKTVDCIFIGYAHNSSAYRFLVLDSKISDIHKNTIMESRNASFFEHLFLYKSKEEESSFKRTYDTMIENSQAKK